MISTTRSPALIASLMRELHEPTQERFIREALDLVLPIKEPIYPSANDI